MTRRNEKAFRSQEMFRFAIEQSSLGVVLVATSAQGVTAILIGDDPDLLVRSLEDRFRDAQLLRDDSAGKRLVARVVGLIETPGIGVDFTLDMRGTAFQQRVWHVLRGIPIGSTASYTEVARRIGRPEALRAVASACAANNIAVAIPCHRVVRSDGALSGYAWGIERKRSLIERESRACGTGFPPEAGQLISG